MSESKKLIDFKEERAKAKGEVTKKALIENLLHEVEKGNVESIIYTVKTKSGEVHLGYSKMSQLEAIGLLECGKSYVIDDMYE